LLSKVPDDVPQTHYKLIQKSAGILLSALGWKITGRFPQEKKFILIVAPHTSNWDFIISMLVMLSLNLKVTFLGKKSIFIGPFKWLLIKLGGVAIDRTHHQGVAGQMVKLFKQREKMILGLSPEGTRSKINQWKTGFLVIAKKANVPIVPIRLDFAKKEVEILPIYQVDKDIDEALIEIKDKFVDVCAKNPQLV
jgi:1-acyl-sn-glycerol-3-phosphate acyltransferase